jgi:hypothetical protein
MKTFLLSFLFLLSCRFVQAQDSGGLSGGSKPWLLSQGSAAREAKRFTLQSWLENKDRRALMDMWLTINTPSPYEFVIGGSMFRYSLDTSSANTTNSQSFNKTNLEVSAYAKFVGVSAEYSNNYDEGFNDVTGIFNLRVFGNTVQGSHITLHYGLRTRRAENKTYRLNQLFPALTLQIYLMKYFGIQGNYRAYQAYSENFYGDTTGDEIQAGAFIEYGILRIFGDWYQERQNSKLNSIETNLNRSGNKIGIKFYF